MDTPRDKTIWMRSEDAENPKVERLRRAVEVEIGPAGGVELPWVVWGAGLSRSWLMEMLEAGAQVLIMPPWMDGGFAGLPPVRLVEAPESSLLLDGESFMVSATNAIDPSPAWREHGRFSDSRFAWLVAHEPFAGSGQAWLLTAELLVASPLTRPRDARTLTSKLVTYLTRHCPRKEHVSVASTSQGVEALSDFRQRDIPYLLAATVVSSESAAEDVAQFISRRIGVDPDLGEITRILSHPAVSSELALPVGRRRQIAQVIDNLGGRSFRLEIEETCHE